MGKMVNRLWILCMALVATSAWADVRYTLKCEFTSSDKTSMQTGALANAMRDCSTEILQTASKQLTRTTRGTQILDIATGDVILLDTEKKTFTRSTAETTGKMAQSNMQQLQAMGAKLEFKTEPIPRPRVITGFEAKGLASDISMSFQMPGMPQGVNTQARMEFWVSETAPGAKELIESAKKNKVSSPMLRTLGPLLASIPGGAEMMKNSENLLGQLLELNLTMETQGLPQALQVKMVMRAENFSTEPIDPKEFEIPAGFSEVK